MEKENSKKSECYATRKKIFVEQSEPEIRLKIEWLKPPVINNMFEKDKMEGDKKDNGDDKYRSKYSG